MKKVVFYKIVLYQVLNMTWKNMNVAKDTVFFSSIDKN